MIGQIIRWIEIELSSQDPERLKNLFYTAQIGFGLFILAMIWILMQKGPGSSFKLREADRLRDQKKKRIRPEEDLLALAKMQKKKPDPILLLQGISLDLPPHELLGVPNDATEEQIQKAYRRLMMQYHPDRVGPPGSREWTDAQKIAEAINSAKETLLKQKRGASGK